MITLCICGLQIVAMDASAADPVWIHRVNTTSCKEPAPSAWTVTKYEREQLSEQWADVGPGLDRAAIEMAALRQQMSDVDASLTRMEARLIAPAVVRRATLNQVWDRLVDDGEMAAARIVMDMIKRIVDVP